MVRQSIGEVFPVAALAMMMPAQVSERVCGPPEVDVEFWKSVSNFDAAADHSKWFWTVVGEFTNKERSLLLRFVWGRDRLPRTAAALERKFTLDFTGTKGSCDGQWPTAATCSFKLVLPRYSTLEVTRAKLRGILAHASGFGTS